ncbi:DUF1381 domain-containing protein [Staphylococcus gallinarum]|uniref:Phage protein n=1 Tax=Staphylococcus gallinarum TaxID=1293 RepID=A0A0D0SNH1_STAGA|nr:DUF1381 domain-containing protein [Staphylococcus gallinarum]KIR10664.1 hypothetical protein SH09_10880 [Staphylococcus gallinarum]RTX82868.1 DUF1381 domain-containing protein [Staphylococcus gallinarum]GEQ04553.1 hypothetical protein SGA02_03810 [Staphylococcus gallinarum]SUM32108.1 phage protein [Staphylococcus gallinarum]
MQYLIRTIQHNGQPFTDVIKAKDNETYQVVEAESKEEAELLAGDKKVAEMLRGINYFKEKDSEING